MWCTATPCETGLELGVGVEWAQSVDQDPVHDARPPPRLKATATPISTAVTTSHSSRPSLIEFRACCSHALRLIGQHDPEDVGLGAALALAWAMCFACWMLAPARTPRSARPGQACCGCARTCRKPQGHRRSPGCACCLQPTCWPGWP